MRHLLLASPFLVIGCGHAHLPRAAIPAGAPHVVMIGAAHDPAEVRLAVGRALASSSFSIESDQPGKMVAAYRRGARMLELEIAYDASNVSFRYLTSQGMEASVDGNGAPLLDRHYGDLVTKLDASVQRELAAASAPPPPDLEQLITAQAVAAAPGASRQGEVFVGTGDRGEWSIALSPNTCYWVIGAGEPQKIGRLELYLWDPANHRVTESHNDRNIAVAGTCATNGGMYKFQAKVQSGSGEYKVAVFAKPATM